jgi:hypothetical protein
MGEPYTLSIVGEWLPVNSNNGRDEWTMHLEWFYGTIKEVNHPVVNGPGEWTERLSPRNGVLGFPAIHSPGPP